MEYSNKFNSSILDYFLSVLQANLADPRAIYFLARTALKQRKAAQKRRLAFKEGVNVPPLMIFSVTNRCNLGCAGCYNEIRAGQTGKELETAEMLDILDQAGRLGVSIALFAGGEPLLRKDLFTLAASRKDMIFPVFTNGTAINEDIATRFAANRNIIPVISLEGGGVATDLRRGPGTYARLKNVFRELKGRGVLFGVSITATSENFEEITGQAFISSLRSSGCRLFFYVEYVPVAHGTRDLVLGEARKKQLISLMPGLDSKYKAVFITFPGNEELYGGCLASGRGFVHVSPYGELEPCPFAPYSDVSLRGTPLKEALASGFLEKLRANHGKFKETSGGCALWSEREWVASILK